MPERRRALTRMKRRSFITLLGGAAIAWPLAARAQQLERVRRIGILTFSAESDEEGRSSVAALRGELRKLGWMEGLWSRSFAEVGGLVSYGPYIVDEYRRAALYVDRILKGTKPSELPVRRQSSS